VSCRQLVDEPRVLARQHEPELIERERVHPIEHAANLIPGTRAAEPEDERAER
jgi:hypothetical protein